MKKGHILLPYIFKTESTSINGEVVWYKNRWKNFFLKVKHFFFKPKYLKNSMRSSKKIVNPEYYTEIDVSNKRAD